MRWQLNRWLFNNTHPQTHETLFAIAEMNKMVALLYSETDCHFNAVHDHLQELVARLASIPVCTYGCTVKLRTYSRRESRGQICPIRPRWRVCHE